MRCPKCGVGSGDDWSQCNGSCPIPISPYYDKYREDALTPEQLDQILVYERRQKQKEREKKPASGVEPEPDAYKAPALPLSHTGKETEHE